MRIPLAKKSQDGTSSIGWPRAAAAGLVLGIACGAMTAVAPASHYHVNCNNHGLVHGSSTTDGWFHSRVEGTPCQRGSRCDVGQFSTIYYYGSAGAGVTCNQLLNATECAGNAWVRLNDAFAYHRHDAHSPC